MNQSTFMYTQGFASLKHHLVCLHPLKFECYNSSLRFLKLIFGYNIPKKCKSWKTEVEAEETLMSAQSSADVRISRVAHP